MQDAVVYVQYKLIAQTCIQYTAGLPRSRVMISIIALLCCYTRVLPLCLLCLLCSIRLELISGRSYVTTRIPIRITPSIDTDFLIVTKRIVPSEAHVPRGQCHSIHVTSPYVNEVTLYAQNDFMLKMKSHPVDFNQHFEQTKKIENLSQTLLYYVLILKEMAKTEKC